MIHLLSGTLISKTPDAVVLSCGGVGFYVSIPASIYAALPETGGSATLYTCLNVKEDALELYGFADEAQQAAYRMLTGVSGVGPKVALAILSLYDPGRVALCVASGDYKAFTACSGVGPKLAQRLVLELKDKVGSLGGAEAVAIAESQGGSANGAPAEALAALVALGFSNSEGAAAIAKLPQTLSAEELIAAALRSMAK